MNATPHLFDFAGGELDTPPNPAQSLLDRLRFRGVLVEAHDGQLSLDAPKGALEDLLPDLQRFKPQLLELLTAAPDALGENTLEIFRGLRLAGASFHLEFLDGEERLVWQLPDEQPNEWRASCAQWIERERAFIIGRLEFERWHWRTCAEHFGENGKPLPSAPAFVFHRDWRQFHRFSVGSQDADDLKDLARSVVDSRRAGGGLDYSRFKVAFRVACELGGRAAQSNEVMAWAHVVVGESSLEPLPGFGAIKPSAFYLEGVEAARAGQSLDDCPHGEPFASDQWMLGFSIERDKEGGV